MNECKDKQRHDSNGWIDGECATQAWNQSA